MLNFKKMIILCILVMGSVGLAQDVCPPSFDPPKGLPIDKVPMFIAFGYDDNNYGDGMNWILEDVKDLKNPNGMGNSATYDGSKVQHTFFMKTKVESTEPIQDVYRSWKDAYDAGHEIASHTHTHEVVSAGAVQSWTDEIAWCDSVLAEIGIPKEKLVGFRTPKLAPQEATFKALVERGFSYDCTVEHFQDMDSKKFVWPYTLENGRHSTAFNSYPFNKYPGLWEFPVHQFLNGKTGFDYNAWISEGLSGSAYYNRLKGELDHRMNTNRAPLLLGVHSDYYATTNSFFESQTSSNVQARRKAIHDFIRYALKEYPDVRIVSYESVLKWMRNPRALDDVVTSTHTSLSTIAKNVKATVKNNSITVSIPHRGSYQVAVYSMNGKKIMEHRVTAMNKSSKISLSRNTLGKGTFLISVVGEGINKQLKTFLR